jgi:hypothetical protein
MGRGMVEVFSLPIRVGTMNNIMPIHFNRQKRVDAPCEKEHGLVVSQCSIYYSLVRTNR